MISFDRLWKLLIDKKINKVELARRVGFSTATLAKMSKEGNVSLKVLEKICKNLGCTFDEIMEIVPDPVDGSATESVGEQ